MKCNQSHPGFELVSQCPFPTTITITPRAPHLILYGRCDTGSWSFFINFSLHIDHPICPKDFELWFVNPPDFILHHFFQSSCAFSLWSHLTLFSFVISGFLTAILLYRPASKSFHLTVDADTFSLTLVMLMFKAFSLFFTQAGAWWTFLSQY